MLMGRIFSYHDTHLHRIGANYQQLPINAPGVEIHSYNSDGPMRYHHAGAQPMYAPNSYGGPEADQQAGAELSWPVAAGELGRQALDRHVDDDDFGQAGTLYRETMDDAARDRMVTNIVGHASDRVSDAVQLRVIDYWKLIDPQLGARVSAGLRPQRENTKGCSPGRATEPPDGLDTTPERKWAPRAVAPRFDPTR